MPNDRTEPQPPVVRPPEAHCPTDTPHWSHDWVVHDSSGGVDWYWCWGVDWPDDSGYALQ